MVTISVGDPSVALLSDSELDAAYAAYWDAGDHTSANVFAQEILTRLESLGSFVEGLFNYTRFPLYEARISQSGGFSQTTTAQTSLAQSAGDLANAAGSAIKSGLGALGTGAVLGVAVVVILGVLYFTHEK